MKRRRRVGQRTVSYTGRVVYEREQHPFRLIRIAKIIDKIFNAYNEKDSEIGPRGGSVAPNSTIFYIFNRAEVWLENRGVFFEIFQRHFSPDLQRLDTARGTPEYARIAEEIFQRFDQFFGFVQQLLGVVIAMAPELEPIANFLDKLIDFYQWVRENYPTGA